MVCLGAAWVQPETARGQAYSGTLAHSFARHVGVMYGKEVHVEPAARLMAPQERGVLPSDAWRV